MTPPRQRKGNGGPARAPQVQDRPAAPAQRRVLDPGNRDGEFLPNPAPAVREGRQAPTERHLRVIGPKPMGPDGVRAPGWLVLELTDPQLNALLEGGHVEDWDGVPGWGQESPTEAEPDPDGAHSHSDAEPDTAQDEGEGPSKEGS